MDAIWNFPRGRSSHCKNLFCLSTVFCSPNYGVNLRGLLPNDLWQIDVKHISDFGKLKYVHVTIDTFSGFIMATLQSREASKHCIQHCLRSFSTMGLPKCIKTNNGPGYVGCNFQTFCALPCASYTRLESHIIHRAKELLSGHIKPSAPTEKIKKGKFVCYYT